MKIKGLILLAATALSFINLDLVKAEPFRPFVNKGTENTDPVNIRKTNVSQTRYIQPDFQFDTSFSDVLFKPYIGFDIDFHRKDLETSKRTYFNDTAPTHLIQKAPFNLDEEYKYYPLPKKPSERNINHSLTLSVPYIF